MIDAQHRHRAQRAGRRNYDDVSEILPFDQMLRTRVAYKADSIAIPVARTEGITTIAVRPGGGTISGEIPVMNLDGWTWEEATLRPTAGLALNFPGAARRTRRRRGRRTRRRAGAGRPRSDEDAEPAARSRARLREAAGGRAAGRLDARAVPARARSAAGDVRHRHDRAVDSRRRRVGREAGRAASCCTPAPTCSASPGSSSSTTCR